MFPAFIYVNNIESLVNNLFGVKTLNPFPASTSCSSHSYGIMSEKSADFLHHFSLSYKPIHHFQTRHDDHMLQELN